MAPRKEASFSNPTSVMNSSPNGNGNIPKGTVRRKRGPKTPSFGALILMAAGALGAFQLLVNAILFRGMEMSGSIPGLDKLESLQRQLIEIEQKTSVYVDDGNFFPFSIRDSRRLVPTQPDPGLHVFDYIDIHNAKQVASKRSQLFHQGRFVAKAACQAYSLRCYKRKVLQVFDYVLERYPHTKYFFYVEADNELCVSLSEIRRLAYESDRYFIATGVGFSGWIMSRQFMIDFVEEYRNYVPPPQETDPPIEPIPANETAPPQASEGPDPIASFMLIDKQAWAVTRRYLVSHTTQTGLGSGALTVKMPSEMSAELPASKKKLAKHLPRCLEPRRAKWRISRKDHRDRFGWDYFDYDVCPDAEIFPCYKGQLEELLAKDMANFNYTQLDEERQKRIKAQAEKERKKKELELKKKKMAEEAKAAPKEEAAKEPVDKAPPPVGGVNVVGVHQTVFERQPERLQQLVERVKARHKNAVT